MKKITLIIKNLLPTPTIIDKQEILDYHNNQVKSKKNHQRKN
jgi:hypothetical protein